MLGGLSVMMCQLPDEVPLAGVASQVIVWKLNLLVTRDFRLGVCSGVLSISPKWL